ncbi:MAG: S9 family peptidase [Bacteroidia bacterium]|nr:S9 family peptidase [Bacteroidia bacterium]
MKLTSARLIPFVLLLMMAFACQQKEQTAEVKKIIGPPTGLPVKDVLYPELLWMMGRIGEVQSSPDGSKLLLTITYYDLDENKGNAELWLMNTDGSDLKRLTETPFGEFNPRWRTNEIIAFLSTESGNAQLWEMKTDGSGKKQLSNIEKGLNGFAFSPDGTKIVYASDVKVNPTATDLHPDLPKTTGRIMNDLMYRHWDHWVDDFSHVFVADFGPDGIVNVKDIMQGEPWESPLNPFGGMEQIAWSPDGKTVVYTARKKKGIDYAKSTNSDLYAYNLETGITTNLTEGMMGYDQNPVFSPDGQYLAWESMERDGYEADKIRLFVMNMSNGEKQYLTKDFDQNVHSLVWSPDGSKLYFTSNWHALDQVYSINLSDNQIRKITDGVHSYTEVMLAGDKLIGKRMAMSYPVELFAIDETNGDQQQITFINKSIFDNIRLGRIEERWLTTTDNKQMHTWVVYPPDFDPGKKYPALLYCQGGPQSTVSQFWSFRWNLQLMAANGYIVVAPNRRGLPGFGQEWLEQISGDYGGQNMRDYLTAIDALAKEPFVDENRLGAVGASYGGFSVYWLAGHHNKRFKAFIAHNGMFNLEQQYLETEEMWFADWDLGGPYWDKNNKVAQLTYANSPHKFVDKWDTPILVIHSEKDYRIVASQGMAAFNAAILRGLPAQYLYFPDENHWVLRPQNSVLWQRTFFGWLDKWLKTN